MVCLPRRLVWIWNVPVALLCTRAQKCVCLLLRSPVALQDKHSASGTGPSHARRGLSPRVEFAPSRHHNGDGGRIRESLIIVHTSVSITGLGWL